MKTFYNLHEGYPLPVNIAGTLYIPEAGIQIKDGHVHKFNEGQFKVVMEYEKYQKKIRKCKRVGVIEYEVKEELIPGIICLTTQRDSITKNLDDLVYKMIQSMKKTL